MEHGEQVRLLDKALELVASRKTDMAATTFRVPVDNYISEQRFQKEVQLLFRGLPLVVGFSSQVRRPGDYFTHDLTGVRILVTRTRTGDLKAFLNVCRHRGASVVTRESGSGLHDIECPFHGWCYQDDGRLKAITHPVGFPDIDKEKLGLVELPADERAGLVFVIPTSGKTLDLDQYLRPILKELEGFGLNKLVMTRATRRTKKMNWKIHKDTEHENYHFSYLHKNSAGSAYFNNVSILDYYKPHTRGAVPQRSVTTLAHIDRKQWRIQDHMMLFYSIFPNTGLVLFNGYAHVLMTFPVDVDTCVLYGAMLVPETTDEREIAKQGFHYESYWATMTEDIDIGVVAYANIRSGANVEYIFGRFEYIAANFHTTIDEVLSGRLKLTSESPRMPDAPRIADALVKQPVI